MTNRPQELRQPHVYGNWRVKSSKRHVSAQQRREGNSAKHLAAIRKCPCCACLKFGRSDPHHLKSLQAGEERAFGRRATDRWAVPLCREHHDQIEAAGSRREVSVFKEWNIDDPHALAEALWNAPRDPAAMTAIILAHRQHKPTA